MELIKEKGVVDSEQDELDEKSLEQQNKVL